MKCKNCGCEYNEGFFCPECGTKNEEEKPVVNPAVVAEEKDNSISDTTDKNSKNKGSALPIVLLIISIIAFLLSFCFGFGGLLAIPILIVSIVLLLKKNKSKLLWVTLALSCITMVVSLIVLITAIGNAKKNADKIWEDAKTIANYGYEEEEKEPSNGSDENINDQDETNVSEDTSNSIDLDYDAANYRNISEDELVSKLGCQKNEYGIYPSIDNPIFMCDNNYVRTIVIDNDDDFTFLDLKLGDSLFENDYPEFSKEYRDYYINGTDREYEGNDGNVGIRLEDMDSTKIIAISWVSSELGFDTNYNQSSADADGYSILYGKFIYKQEQIWDRDLEKYVDSNTVYTIEWYEDSDSNSQMIIGDGEWLEYIGYFPGDYPFNPDANGWWIVELTNDTGENLEVKINIDVDKNEVSKIVIEDKDDFYSRNLAGEYKKTK